MEANSSSLSAVFEASKSGRPDRGCRMPIMAAIGPVPHGRVELLSANLGPAAAATSMRGPSVAGRGEETAGRGEWLGEVNVAGRGECGRER